MARVKVCGVTAVEQAGACVALGVDAIGVNLVPSSPRRVDEARARAIVEAVGSRTLVVAVVLDEGPESLRGLAERTGVGCLQIHGSDGATVRALLPHAYGAVAVATAEDVAKAAAMPGEYVLVDAKSEGQLGGTGKTFDWELVRDLAKTRRLVLAGGLTPENVAQAIGKVGPWCVDVASGVESGTPGVKDLGKVRAFVAAARASLGEAR